MRHDLDFDPRPPRESSHLDRGTGRRIRGETSGVDLVHGRKLRKVDHEDRGFHDVPEGEALVAKDGLQVVQHAGGLRLDVAGDGRPRVGWIQGDLAGGEEQVAKSDGLAVGANRRRRALGTDDLFGGHRELEVTGGSVRGLLADGILHPPGVLSMRQTAVPVVFSGGAYCRPVLEEST